MYAKLHLTLSFWLSLLLLLDTLVHSAPASQKSETSADKQEYSSWGGNELSPVDISVPYKRSDGRNSHGVPDPRWVHQLSPVDIEIPYKRAADRFGDDEKQKVSKKSDLDLDLMNWDRIARAG